METMNEYSIFAKYYDRMMGDIPYEEWEQYLLLLFYRFGVKACGKICEIGCGTGTVCGMLAAEGFEMTGVDRSEEMLKQAKRKIGSTGVTYLLQDMRELSLSEKQDAIVCICDGMNYLETTNDLEDVLRAAFDNLKDGGVFIFDLKTEYFFKNSLDGRTFKEKTGDTECTWKNRYDTNTHTHEYELTFTKDGKEAGVEVHRQRIFNASDLKNASIIAGFKGAAVYEALSLHKPRKDSERIYVVIKKV